MSLFQLAHANEVPDGNMCEYEIKHYFLRARDLHHAHVYVTLYGHQITPGFYEDTIEDMPETYHEYAKKAADERNLEMYETMNEECSKGEHFWHSIKKADQEKYDGQLPVNGEKITKWKDIQELFEKETNCLGDGHRHGEFVVLKLEILSEPIGIIDCDD
ncbi:hypothetical protein I4U23_022802 [Adineta vaga]|nr:hypothetical protein I4U23_022802 [Adineta vaga]